MLPDEWRARGGAHALKFERPVIEKRASVSGRP